MSDVQKRKKSKRSGKIVLTAAVIIIAAVIIVLIVRYNKSKKDREEIAKGVDYLESLEKQDVSEIQQQIKSTRSSIGLELADTDEGAIWSAMSDAVILGDSRAVGFSYYEFMTEDHVLAKSGAKITDTTEYLDQLAAMQPTEVFLCYGLNDVGIGLWPTGDEYAVEYEKQVNELKSKIPGATIYVNSILPAVGVGLEADSDYPRIGEYNTALEAMCKKNNWPYIDSTKLAEEHVDLYQQDGLHLQKEFYKYWAANMLTEVGN